MESKRVMELVCNTRAEADRIGNQFIEEMRQRFDTFLIYLGNVSDLASSGDLSHQQMVKALKNIKRQVINLSYLPQSISNMEQKRAWDQLVGQIETEM